MVLVVGYGLVIIREWEPDCCYAPCAQAVSVKAWSSGCLCPGCGL